MKKLLLTFLIAFITALGANATTTTLQSNAKSDGTSINGTVVDDIKITCSGGQGTKFYSAAFRMYASAALTFKCTSGENITKIEFLDCHTGDYKWGTPGVNNGTLISTGTFTTDETVATWTGNASEVTITNKKSNQVRFKTIVVTYGPAVLGDIMMGSTAVSTDEDNPTTTSVKGDAKIEFTSANAASISVYTLPYTEEDKPAASEGSPSVTWTAPAAKESEQTVRLKVVSKLGTDTKEAYVTVTVQKKADVSDNFVLITDAKELFDGMEFYIADTNGNFVMGADRGNNRTAVSGAQITNNILTPKDTYSLVTLVDTKKRPQIAKNFGISPLVKAPISNI